MAGTPVEALEERWTVLFDDAVTGHLFEVAAGLRSSVLGETEVLGQVRRALERAEAEHASGPVLSALFRHAVQAGRQVRSHDRHRPGPTSLSHVAVELAAARLGWLAGRAARARGRRRRDGRGHGRRPRRGRGEPAARSWWPTAPSAGPRRWPTGWGATAWASTALADALALGRRRPRVDRRRPARARRRAPRPAAAARAGGPAWRRSWSSTWGAPQRRPRRGRLAGDRAARHGRPHRARRAGPGRPPGRAVGRPGDRGPGGRALPGRRAGPGGRPVVSALRARVEELRRAELERHRARLAELDERQWQEVDSVVRDVLAKLLHHPTVAVKEAAGTPRGERLVEALRTLFDL